MFRFVSALLSLSVALLVVGCGDEAAPTSGDERRGDGETDPAPRGSDPAQGANAEEASGDGFAGVERCAACHPEQARRWRGSDHDRAMQAASREALLAPFDGETLVDGAGRWRFLIADGAFFVELEAAGAGEAPERLRVTHAFGVRPIQQLLVERPQGRLQALPVAWDTREASVGGARWISLQPDARPGPEDPLHWDGFAYRWNVQCAACHSTAVEKGFDAALDAYATRFAEIDVGCEACHGPGGRHAAERARAGEGGEDGEWEAAPGRPKSPSNDLGGAGAASLPVRFERWAPNRWQREGDARIASLRVPRRHDAQLDVCGPCHARRGTLVEAPTIGAPLLDGHRPSLLEPGLYFDDGQIRDEVYVWGSFLQSRMHAAGVRCNDCHDPHALTLRREGNALCGGCHDPAAFDVAAHRGHAAGGAGSACIDCHMPARTYMRVDPRRDHAFPVPRPMRSAALGAPGACRGCHADQAPAALAEAVARWRGARPVPAHWSDRLVESVAAPEGRGGAGPVAASPDAGAWRAVALDPAAPPIVRGGAWLRLGRSDAPLPDRAVLAARLREGEDLERLGLVEVVRRLPPRDRMALLGPLLEHPRRALRVAAAEVLADGPLEGWRPAERARLARALREHRAALTANADRPEAQLGLGLLALRYGEPAEARAAYRRAIERAPWFVPAYVNLADLERLEGRAEASVDWLRRAVALAPEDAEIRHALGLALHRLGRPEEALDTLARASQDAPDSPRFAYAWALALDGLGRRAEALEVLEAAVERGAADADLHAARVAFLLEAGRARDAAKALARFARAYPEDPRLAPLRRALGPDAPSRSSASD